MTKKELLQNEIDRHRENIGYQKADIEGRRQNIIELEEGIKRAIERKKESEILLEIAEINFADAVREEQTSKK